MKTLFYSVIVFIAFSFHAHAVEPVYIEQPAATLPEISPPTVPQAAASTSAVEQPAKVSKPVKKKKKAVPTKKKKKKSTKKTTK